VAEQCDNCTVSISVINGESPIFRNITSITPESYSAFSLSFPNNPIRLNLMISLSVFTNQLVSLNNLEYLNLYVVFRHVSVDNCFLANVPASLKGITISQFVGQYMNKLTFEHPTTWIEMKHSTFTSPNPAFCRHCREGDIMQLAGKDTEIDHRRRSQYLLTTFSTELCMHTKCTSTPHFC